MKYNTPIIWIFLVLVLFTSSCAPHPIDIVQCIPDDTEPLGFWLGLWHGLISPITFIISLFTDDVTVYAINNNGGWYNFGFLIGVGGLISSRND